MFDDVWWCLMMFDDVWQEVWEHPQANCTHISSFNKTHEINRQKTWVLLGFRTPSIFGLNPSQC
jgi:hypothetical protein